MKTRTGEIRVEGTKLEIKDRRGEFSFEIPLSVQNLLRILDVLEGRERSFRIGRAREGKRYLLEVFVPSEDENAVVIVGKIFEGEELKGKKSFLLKEGKYFLLAELKEAIRKLAQEGFEIKRFVSPLYYSLSQRGLYLIWKEEDAYVPKRSLEVLKEALKSGGSISVGKVKVEKGRMFIGDREVDEEHRKEIERILELL